MQSCLPSTDAIETIRDGDAVLACLIRGNHRPRATEFMTPDDWNQQVGFIVYPRGGEIARHRHLPIQRTLTGTAEVLLVREGRCEVDFFDADANLVATRVLTQGDVLVLVSGGHGFRMLEDTILLEVKQGPYTGLQEKSFF